MSKPNLTGHKKRTLLLSLYALTGFTFAGYLLLIIGSLIHLILFSSPASFYKFTGLFVENLLLVVWALVISLPFAGIITFMVVSNVSARLSPLFQSLLYWVDQAPVLLFGLFLLATLGPQASALVLIYFMIAVVKISKRWIKLSKTVPSAQRDAGLALGMNLQQMVYTIYIKRFFKEYAAGFIAVGFLLLTVFTPFITIYSSENRLITLELFRRLGREAQETASIVSILLLCHVMKVVLDNLAQPEKVRRG